MSRAGAPKVRAKREATEARCGQARAFAEVAADPNHPRRVAMHEAGHAVVSHALGARPICVSVAPKILPRGHPENPSPTEPAIRGGYQASEPLTDEMADAILMNGKSGEPFTDAETEWLRRSFVVYFAGPIAESAVPGWSTEARLEHAESDHLNAAKAAKLLSRGVVRDGDNGDEMFTVDPEFVHLGQTLAIEILSDEERRDQLGRLAAMLEENYPAEADAEWLDWFFEDGPPRGSHAHLLERLR